MRELEPQLSEASQASTTRAQGSNVVPQGPESGTGTRGTPLLPKQAIAFFSAALEERRRAIGGAPEIRLYGAVRYLLPEQLLNSRVNVAHSQGPIGLLENQNNRVPNRAEAASPIWRDAFGESMWAAGLLPVATRETLEKGRQVVV